MIPLHSGSAGIAKRETTPLLHLGFQRYNLCTKESIFMQLDPQNKIAGVLVPLFALRGRHDLGVGDTEALAEMIEWAAGNKFHAVQILPVNETGGDHSPYNVLSAFALGSLHHHDASVLASGIDPGRLSHHHGAPTIWIHYAVVP